MTVYLTYEGAWGLIVFFFCLSLCTRRLRAARKFETIDFSVLSMGLVFGLLFPVVMNADSSIHIHGAEFLRSMRDVSYAHPFSVMLASIGIIIGWQSATYSSINKWSHYFIASSTKALSGWIYAMLAIAILSQYLYVRDYGGFLGYFSYNELIRSGLFDSFERSRFSFLKPFGGFATLAFLCSWGLLLSGKTGVLNVLAFCVSLVAAVYVAVASGGRVSMVTLLAILPLSLLARSNASYKTWFFLYFFMAASGVLALFWVSYFLELKASESIFGYIAKESSFPFVSFFANLEKGHSFYLFYEVLIWPAFLLPSSLTGSWLLSATDLNTIIVSGSIKGEAGVTGSIPTDIISFGFMQANFIGVLLYPMLMGYFLRFATEMASSFQNRGLSSTFSAYVMIKIGVFSIFYSYPKHILMSHFSLLATLIFIMAIRALRRTLKI